jgi:uncharacterized protein (TIGR02453 family)
MPFAGFTPDSLQFLADLAEHNDRAWFAENRERYERELLERQKEFVAALGTAFAELDPRVQAIPAVNGSIFRINRDIRFSRDKSPYKTHADLWLWAGVDRKGSPGYYLRMVPQAVMIGSGAHWLSDSQIEGYRTAVADEVRGGELGRIIDGLEAEGFELAEPSRKTVPKGFSADHPRAELLKLTEIHVIRTYSPPAEIFGPEFVDWCMARFAQVKPLVDWLAEHIGS